MLFKRGKKINGHAPMPEPTVASYISPDLVIEGNITSNGELHVDGTIHGTIKADVCVVEGNGVVNGSIAANVVFVSGKVFGPINAIEVHLYAGAHVEGDVTNEIISVENGAYIYGSIRRAVAPQEAPQNKFNDLFNGPRPQTDEMPSLNFRQDNAFNSFEDDAFRPIKAVRPR